MSEFVSFEWFKLVRRPMPRVVVILLCGLTIATFCVLSANTGEKGNLFLPRGWLAALSLTSFFAPFFWPLVGATWAGNEYGWGTIRAVLTRRPSRIEHVLAALAVLLVGVALTVLALVAAGTVAGILVALLTGHPLVTTDVWSGAFFVTLLAGTLAAWYVAAFYLLVAYAAATLARSAAVGVGVGLGATLAQYALRSIFSGLGGHWRDFAQHFPIVYANSMITRVVGPQLLPGSALATTRAYEPQLGQSVMGLAIYSAICLAVTLVAVRSRDVTV